MEKQFNREDELIKKLLNEAGTEKPSANFKSRIMKTVEARNAEIKPYEPLITRTGWTSIAVIFILSMTGLSYLYADISLFSDINFEWPHLVSMPKVSLSTTMQYAIAFVALFFLQVPFLKKLMDKEYRF